MYTLFRQSQINSKGNNRQLVYSTTCSIFHFSSSWQEREI
uniref:Uncharacterized protein n=1 Tax=Arundo donax TaxID=35708 RepID=A0A0A9FPE3_ARUDO